jgi:WD40 repeat protein
MCQYSPDGTFMATASNDKTVKVWWPETNMEMLSFTFPNKVFFVLLFYFIFFKNSFSPEFALGTNCILYQGWKATYDNAV